MTIQKRLRTYLDVVERVWRAIASCMHESGGFTIVDAGKAIIAVGSSDGGIRRRVAAASVV